MAKSQPNGRPWWRRHRLLVVLCGVLVVVLLAYAVLAAAVFPAWLISANAGPNASDDHRLDAIANTRAALLGVLAPLVIAIGAVALSSTTAKPLPRIDARRN